MRTASSLLLTGCLATGSALAPALPALAAPGSGTAVVQPLTEAWYRATPACALPTGCADATGAPSPYAADTLHVGVNAGLEEARTYLQLDLTALPAGTKPSGGTLLLPVAAGSGTGTRSADTAKLQACAVTAPIEDADGSFGTPPEVDCEAASVPAAFVPAAGDDPAAFIVSLGALALTWEGSATPGAVALLPAADTAPPETWHVAFSGREREGEDVAPISATVAYVSAVLDTAADSEPFVAPPPFEPAPAFEEPPSFDSGSSFPAPPLTVDMPIQPQPAPQQAPVAAPEQQLVPVATVLDRSFRYPAVFLLPLLFAAAAAWLGRALTCDLVHA